VDNSSDGGEEAGGTVVVLISPGLAEEDDSPFRGFKPSFATNFGGFLPSNFELGSVLDSSETDVLHSFGIPGVSVSISVTDQEKEQAAQPAEVELTFNLKDILDQAIGRDGSLGSLLPGQGGAGLGDLFGGGDGIGDLFGGGSRGGLSGLSGLGDFLGGGGGLLGDDNPLTSFNLFASPEQRPSRPSLFEFGSGSLDKKADNLGEFSVLTGPPWTGFQSIFTLYNQPSHPGYRAVFGPGPACGLCSLFPLGHDLSSFVTLELVLTQPDDNQYDYIEIEALPGGSVLLLNDSAIRVVDQEGTGVCFVLNQQQPREQDGDGGVDARDPSVESDSDQDDLEENTTRATSRVDNITTEKTMETTKAATTTITTTAIIEATTITEKPPTTTATTEIEASTATSAAMTTVLPAVLDPGRFDIANDKISKAGEEVPAVTAGPAATDPTLAVDPGLLE